MIADSIGEPGPAAFRIGSVIARSFSTLFGNIVPFGLLALLFTSPPVIARLLLDDMSFELYGELIVVMVEIFSYFVLGSLLSATLTYGTIQELRGKRASIIECISSGLSQLPSVIGVSIVVGLLGGLGMIMLIVPGIIVIVVYWVAIPVAVIERSATTASLSHSVELTRGYRWPILGILLILLILFAIIVPGAVLLAEWWADPWDSHLRDGTLPLAMVAEQVATAFASALFAVAGAVGYHDLRVAQEGADTEQIAAVFD